MSDIRCVVCGEPWDAYGVNHGEMAPWQARLFKAGAGCPACEGVQPESRKGYEPTMADIENGDEDPMVRLVALENVDKRPAWIQPAPTLIYQCACCGIKVLDNTAGADLPEDALITEARGERQWRSEYKLRKLPDDEVREGFTFACADKPRVCPACVEHCDECGAACCDELSTDVYDGLASFQGDGCGRSMWDRFCIDCFERLSSENESEDEDEESEAEDND